MDFFDFTGLHFYIGLALSVFNGVLLCFMGYKFMQIIQLSGYKTKGYFYWLKDTHAKYIGRLFMLCAMSTAALIVTNICFSDPGVSDYWRYIGLAFYFTFSIVFIYHLHNAPQKTPLKLTNRMNRAIGLLFFISAALTFGLITLSTYFLDWFRFGAVALAPLSLPLTVPLVHWILKPVEKIINNGYVHQTKKKLGSMPALVKIGITGSLGKTSTKNFLDTILSEQYSVCATPLSYNTPMGVTKSVIQFLAPTHQVFICEMGARNVGDISQLCKIVEPGYGIITSIGNQHMATFKSLDNVQKAKGELAAAMPESGFMVFNGDNAGSMKIYNDTKCEKSFVSLNNKKADAWASGIEITTEGTRFRLNFAAGGGRVDCSTKLLGEHNITNILLCAVLAKKLGLSNEQIASGIGKLKSVEHRLELIKGSNGVVILDDTYNASVEGSERALGVMRLFDASKKIVVTPGLVELGSLERLENYNFGRKIAAVADVVIIVNKTNAQALESGLKDAGFDARKIHFAETLIKAREMLPGIVCEDAVVLFENDLPDNYT
ncbi:MAG: UDP-N-acetylmuramoyl-tripeptide--D-alanyl-D-alanine ligase [Firmicutes bacterium]|nr:UDP-N-acetylmuramoyl-tripeptide--D-alanyl-D-alanine ligase [Bacillota bacterium]